MKKRSFSLQTHLLALLAVVLLPIFLAGTIATVLGARQLHQAALQQLQDNANAWADILDQRFISYAQILHLKATNLLQAGSSELPQIQTKTPNPADLMLIDLRDPQQKAALPQDFLAQLASGSDLTVSDLQHNEVTGAFNVAIGLPNSAAPAIANFALLVPAAEIFDFPQSELPDSPRGSLIAVLDSQGHIVARSRNQAQWIGHIAPDWDKLQAMDTQQDWLPVETFEGAHMVIAFKRLDVAKGWVLGVAENQQALEAAWSLPLLGIVLSLLATAAVTVLLVRWASQRILQPLQRVQNDSRALLDWQAPPSPHRSDIRIREFDELSTHLMHAHSLLKGQTEQAQDLAHQLLRNEVRHRTMAEVSALVFWQATPQWEVLHVIGWHELTGQLDSQAQGRGWTSRIHPGDLLSMATNKLTEHTIDAEFRILNVHKRWRWVRVRGAKISSPHEVQEEWAGVLEDVDARLQAQAHIGYLAKYDALTGLVNRRHFHELLESTIAASKTRATAVLSMDLDRFMHINDSLGHAVGDALLQCVTSRLLALLPHNGLLARLGGDEFAILFTTDSPQADIEQLVARILGAFQEPFLIGAHRINTNTCIGAAWSQSSQDRAERVMRHAELALHRAKADGRRPMRFFDPAMEQQMQRRRQMEVDLRIGLESAHFYLVYQPLVDLQTLSLVGFEALLRWQHPTLGVLTPGRFIHIAEELGLMDRLGAWVLEQACQDARDWPDARLTVAVNIAASQLNDQLVQCVTQTLIASALAPDRLELEVTENALMTHIEEAADGLLQLKAQGISIVLDDFGTGFTSLSHLRAFPFNKVKIDKGFVNDLSTIGHANDGEAIISAISLLCKRLGIVAVAEGVETRHQMDSVIGYECQQGQGFLFGHPLRHAETCQLIAQWAQHKRRLQDV
ncbi:EAL domain-containing protein [Lampropedia aestuarii]|uniref:EAL domain-containing protein n=1 Tax=Lampropedia aestuarii TaxID=2562762 RepID=A0A4S5BP05_9BURK|nr:EAL domain-containing protein [Lampropedia aestuarii]MDH5858506.1 EAL domain-containing protein [Lampropedia aestuarii]THJ34019.1 EAL domain-containing protein [Lampropedia aestuarii]